MTARRERPPLTPRMLSNIEAAAYCGVSVNHFNAHVRVQPVKIGERKLWDREALDRWLDQLGGTRYDHVSGDEWLDRG